MTDFIQEEREQSRREIEASGLVGVTPVTAGECPDNCRTPGHSDVCPSRLDFLIERGLTILLAILGTGVAVQIFQWIIGGCNVVFHEVVR